MTQSTWCGEYLCTDGPQQKKQPLLSAGD
jgi:hypothetical protein